MFAVGVTSAWAQQTRKATDTFVADFELSFVGDYNYQYIIQENGVKWEDGPFTMKAKIDDNVEIGNFTCYAKGSYNLKGSHKDGYIDGPLTMDANLQVVDPYGNKESTTYTFRGNFKRGLPEGNFTVNYPSYAIKVNVNYKDGLLVGSYMVSGYDDNGLLTTISGSLSDDSKPTGAWKYETAKETIQFAFTNGIQVNRPDYDNDLIDKAKAFAEGTITEEQLNEENIIVVKEILPVGAAARNFILHDGIAFNEMGGYNFSQSENAEFFYLDRLVSLSADGVQKMKEDMVGAVKMIYGGTYNGNSAEAQAYRLFARLDLDEETGRYFAEMDDEYALSSYCLGYPDWSSDYIVNVYFTEAEVEELKLALHEVRMEYLDALSLDNVNLDFSSEDIFKYYFAACEYDENVIVCKPSSEHTYYYVSRDKFEDHSLAYGIDEELLLANTPESRYEIVKQKVVKRDEKVAERCKDVAIEWLSGDAKVNNKYLQGVSSPKGDLPVVGYMVTGVKKEDKSRFAVAVKVDIAIEPVTSANLNTVRYKTYEMNIYVVRQKSDLKMDYSSTFKESNFVNVKNDFDIIDELDDKFFKGCLNVKNLDAKIYELFKVYAESVNNALTRDDLKAMIAAKQGLLDMIKDIHTFVDMRKTLLEEDGNIANKYATNKALVKAYKRYCETRDLSWTPESNIEKMQQYLDVQSGVHQYVERIAEIDSLNQDIADRCAYRKDVHKAYLKHKKETDFAWNAESRLEMLAGYIEMQKMLMLFVDRLDEIDANEGEIKDETVAHKDVSKAYFAYAKTLDLSWSADKGVEALDAHIAIQQHCLEFVELRSKVAENHNNINKLKSKASAIHKVYAAYFKGCDLSWTTDVDFAAINAVLDVQDRYLSGIDNPDIEAINKQVKKEKIDDIEQVLILVSE